MARIILALVVTFSFAFLVACGGSSGSGGSKGANACEKNPFDPACLACGQKLLECLEGPCKGATDAYDACYESCEDEEDCIDQCDDLDMALASCVQSKCKDAFNCYMP